MFFFLLLFIFKLKVKLFQKAELGRLITQNTFHTNPLFYIKPLEFSLLLFLLSAIRSEPPSLLPPSQKKKQKTPQPQLYLSFSVSLLELSCFSSCWALATGGSFGTNLSVIQININRKCPQVTPRAYPLPTPPASKGRDGEREG